MENNLLFLTVARQETLGQTSLMIDSLRTFGRELKEVPFWVFATDPENLHELEDDHTHVVPLTLRNPENAYLFERKVTACAQAEALAPPGTATLTWVDPGVVFTAPPLEFLLDEKHDAAFRPVHIRNVGLAVGEPLDSFWKGICIVVGVEDIQGKVTSFVDGQELRTYYNSHAFSILPGLGLMRAWLDTFLQLAHDAHFQAEACQDESHQVFLFQALLSTLVASRLDQRRVKILSPNYNYPYNLQERIPAGRRLVTLNEAICFSYEDLPLHPDKLQEIGVLEPLKGWLEAHLLG
jgi:hypothetical protein